MKNHYWYFYIGLLLTTIFGGSFLIRLIRDGDFYIAEFIGGIVGIVILLIGVFSKKESSTMKS
ncbi:hypothetical protein [Planococcus shixiaomingii]|uniref:hypothetical protein n=1 Tax=Planococcus shixiaomingii TaxID=3058393 RepID=UPI0026216BA7|nr:hypothetical protein [Planococcus sp. N022]WKA55985.1 hypothetical protein QWY21_06360 [Planococcus sp. N022]